MDIIRLDLFSRKYCLILSTFLIGLFICSHVFAENKLTIIQLHYRNANSIIPVLKPLLGPHDAITGHGNTLVIRSSPENIRQLSLVIRSLDVPAKSLIISVKLSNSWSNNNERIIAKTSGASRDANEMQNVRVQNGERAHISLGKEIPYFNVQSNDGNMYIGTDFRPMISGFDVTPHLLGNKKVKLMIYQQFQATGNRDYSSIRNQDVASTITIPLNQWVPLAGAGVNKNRQSHTHVIETTKTSTVYIRVQLANH